MIVDVAPALELLFPGLIVLFILTQSVYFVNNLLATLVIYRKRPERIESTAVPEAQPRIHVLIPIYNEQLPVIEATLDGIEAMAYPASKISVYLVTERDDTVVDEYLSELLADFEGREFYLSEVEVDRDTIASYIEKSEWTLSGDGVPRTKASALKYAFRTLGLPSNDIVTVYDSDTILPPDTFNMAVNGLESYDIVQAKQTVRNHDSGWLPALEAMGIAGWCDTLYQKTPGGPYQLLGKGYFIEVADLYAIGDWQVNALTEDLALGIDAYRNGYSLGVIDRYVQDICPSDFRVWVTQKRRWVAGPYPYLRAKEFSVRDTVQFWTYSLAGQIVALVNVVGVPTGILYLLFVSAGYPLYYSPPLAIIAFGNVLGWGYYVLKSYRATKRGVQFDSRWDKARFYLQSNPVTQLGYSMLWAIPVALAMWDYVGGGPQTGDFHVTQKQVENIRPKELKSD